MYLKYLGNKPITGEKEYELFEDVGFHYPFQVEGIGDPVMRTPFKFNKDENALMCDYDIPQGNERSSKGPQNIGFHAGFADRPDSSAHQRDDGLHDEK